jgi:regulator of sigma E protease
MLTLIAFLIAIAILVTVHEWGHYRMAIACGVRVLQFSVGFGPEALSWISKRSGTRYTIAMLPLGGFVKMLDEREGPVDSADLNCAFNRKPLKARAAIVAAGPLANLVLAVLLYAVVNWTGVVEAKAYLSVPVAESIAERAGFKGGETVERAGFDEESLQDVVSYEDFRWWMTRAALDSKDLYVQYQSGLGHTENLAVLKLSGFQAEQADESMFRKIGFTGPYSKPILGELVPEGAAMAAKLAPGDRVMSVDGKPVVDAAQLRNWIRSSGNLDEPREQDWLIDRQGIAMHIAVKPRRIADGNITIGRVGAVIGAQPEMVTVRYGPIDGLVNATHRTWDAAALTVRMMGQILTGRASLKNLSGPITIADYAGRSAALGLTQYLVFLALVSISLGVLNLLPLPMLDGGHLMYYLWEGVTGRAITDAWMERLQRTGLAILLLMMSVAVFNDLHRLLS